MARLFLFLCLACAGCTLGQKPPTCCSPVYYPFRLGIEADDEKIDSVFTAAGFDLFPLNGVDRAARLWTDDGLSVARVIEVREHEGSCSATFQYRGTEYDSRGGEVKVNESVPFPDYAECSTLFELLAGADTLKSRPRKPGDPFLFHRSIAVHKLELFLGGTNHEFTFWTQPGHMLKVIEEYEAILAAFERASLGPVTVSPDGE